MTNPSFEIVQVGEFAQRAAESTESDVKKIWTQFQNFFQLHIFFFNFRILLLLLKQNWIIKRIIRFGSCKDKLDQYLLNEKMDALFDEIFNLSTTGPFGPLAPNSKRSCNITAGAGDQGGPGAGRAPPRIKDL